MRRSAEREPDDVAAALWRELRGGAFPVVDGWDFEGRSFVVARSAPGVAARWDALSAREREVVAVAADGHANKVIAGALGVATSTVGVHLANARRKLGAKTRAALIGSWLAARGGASTN